MTNLYVTIEYQQEIPQNKQMPEFYVYAGLDNIYAVIKYRTRVAYVGVGGDMYISIPAEDMETGEWVEHEINVCRYSDDLERFAKNDKELMDLLHLWSVEREYEIYHQNPWWEVWSDDYPDGDVYDTFYEAVEGAIKFITEEDEYWDDSLEGLND